MISTFSGLILKSGIAHIFHIGDSRIYLFRNGLLEPLTNDHKNHISADRDYLSKAMGAEANAEVDYRKLEMEGGDTLVFTTDGVHGFLTHKRMVEILISAGDNLNAAAENMVTAANENASLDNQTCQIVRILDTGAIDEDARLGNLSRLPFPPPLEAGMDLDGYKIIRELHASNRTQIYLAKDPDNNGYVVIKTPSVNFEDDPDYLEMFTREEWIGSMISNPHVVKVIKPTRPRRFLYYVSEYVEGQTLRQWMNDNPAPALSEVRAIIQQIITGLRAFHRKEIIHQDIKPENIVIDKDGTIKIIDFGSARVASLQDISDKGTETVVAGTKNYTAPEYHLGYKSSNCSDIYSIGVVVYEMATGHLPYGKPFETRKSLARLSYISARQHHENLPYWMDAAIKKAVNIDPTDRYQTMSEFLGDLTRPNPNFKPDEMVPLIERNPVGFWKGLALVQLVAILALLYFLSI